MEINCHENDSGDWKIRRKKAGMPLGRAGLGSAPAEFQMVPPLPSPDGEFAVQRPPAVFQEDP